MNKTPGKKGISNAIVLALVAIVLLGLAGTIGAYATMSVTPTARSSL